MDTTMSAFEHAMWPSSEKFSNKVEVPPCEKFTWSPDFVETQILGELVSIVTPGGEDDAKIEWGN